MKLETVNVLLYFITFCNISFSLVKAVLKRK